jgi:hypothetical protein
MAITKKPTKRTNDTKLADYIINKGGSSPINSGDDKKNQIKLTVRLPHKMLDIIDCYLEESISKKTRTQWLREAAEEKIAREITEPKQSIQEL